MVTKRLKVSREVMIPVGLGLAALALNFFPIKLFEYLGTDVICWPGLILPLLAALAYGLRGGMIAAVLAVLPYFYLWRETGYGLLFAIALVFGGIAWQGFVRDRRAKLRLGRWYHDRYFAEILFRLVSSAAIIYLYPLMAALPAPFWSPVTMRPDIQTLYGLLVIHVMSSFIRLAIVDSLLFIRPLRRVLGIGQRTKAPDAVFLLSLVAVFLLITVDTVGCTTFSMNSPGGFLTGLLDYRAQHVFVRWLIFVVCMGFGVICYVMMSRAGDQKLMLESAFHAVERKNIEMIESQRELEYSQTMLQTYIDKAPYAIFVVNMDGSFEDCNAHALEMTGYQLNDLDHMKLTGMLVQKNRPTVEQLLANLAYRPLGFVLDTKVKVVMKRGQVCDWHLKLTRMDKDEILVFAEDITDKEIYRQRSMYLAKYDTLTGCYNKNYLNQYMENAVRGGAAMPLSIIFADINGLRRVNEQMGYEAGDKAICALAGALSTFFGGKGEVFRSGGDSFVVALPGIDHAQCCRLVERASKAAEKSAICDDACSLAMGCATTTEGGDWEDTLRRAETRMYASKIVKTDSLRSNVMNSIMIALAERSRETEEHVMRMKRVAVGIAQEMGLGRNRVESVLAATQFHDIGKMAIPDSILFKKKALDDQEWIVMQKHCEIGYRIVKAATDMDEAAEIVLAHHERWDGGGYPQGLKGEQIPVEARIIAVADAFDAMTNERAYQRQRGVNSAIREIRKCTGSQFDPAVVDAFLAFMEKEKQE